MENKTFYDYWLVVYRRRVLVFLTVASAVLTAYFVSARLTPVYRAETEFFVTQDGRSGGLPAKGGVLSSLASVVQPALQKESMKYYKGLLESGAIAERVKEQVGDVELDRLAGKVDISATSTNLMRVRVRDPDPARAARIANAFPKALNGFLLASSRQATERSLATVRKQISETEAALDQSLKRLEAFLAEIKNPAATAETKLQEENLRREVALHRRALENLLDNYQNLQARVETPADKVVVVTRGAAPKTPIFPLPVVNALIAAVLGLIGGIYLAFLVNYIAELRAARLYS